MQRSRVLTGLLEAVAVFWGCWIGVCPIQGQNPIQIACWGDSLTGGTGEGAYCEQLGALTGVPMVNLGIGGQRSGDIAVRMNAYAGKSQQTFGAGFTIPTSGTVTVTWADQAHIPTYRLMYGSGNYPHGLPIRVSDGGVAYTLDCVNATRTGNTATCTPEAYPARAVNVPAGAGWTAVVGDWLKGINLIRAGRNNYPDCRVRPVTVANCPVAADIAAMVAQAAANGADYRVLSIQNGDYYNTEYMNGTGHAMILGINMWMAAAFAQPGYVLGSPPYFSGRFVDVRTNLVEATCAESDGVNRYACQHDFPGISVRLQLNTAGSLATPIDSSATAFSYSGEIFDVVEIGSEYIQVQAHNASQALTAVRGFGGSTAASHGAGAQYASWDSIHENTTGYGLDAALVMASLGGELVAAAPAPPSGLKATAGTAQVALSWNAVSGATKYTVKRGTAAGGAFSAVKSVTATSFTDTTATGLIPGQTYYYVVTASNASGEGKPTAAVQAKPLLGAPAGLTAGAGLKQVALNWTPSAGATKYLVERSLKSGTGFKTVATVAATNFTDTAKTGLVGGTTYYYVVAAVDSVATSPVSAQAMATPLASGTAVNVTVNTLANRHAISEYIYGANFPPTTDYIKAAGVSLNRWGGNATSRYNWKLNTTNTAADWYFENHTWGGDKSPAGAGSLGFVSSVAAAGSAPLMTIPMLPWVAKDGDCSVACSVGFSVAKYGQQCKTDPWNSDAGNGQKTDCSTDIAGNDATDTSAPLKDAPGSGDGAGAVYRSEWVAALKPKFGSQLHFYDLDNEPDIWSGTHRDVHPAPAGYDELARSIFDVGHTVKKYDAAAVRLAPVFCCWWFYWNGADPNDKPNHGGQDFLPWLVNEILFKDVVAGSRSFDVFDVHAYFNGPDTWGKSDSIRRAGALRATRDWWDSTYVSESGAVNQGSYVYSHQPDETIAFVIPRLRAMANSIYPGTPVAFTEWNGAALGDADFSSAMVDADAYGILGRERMYAATRFMYAGQNNNGADPQTLPAFKALLLYRNADGAHNGFEKLSVEARSDGDPNLFSVYAATNAAGTRLTLMVVNKDPENAAAVDFNVKGFTPASMKTYSLTNANQKIVASAGSGWLGNQVFPPYSVTLVVATGKSATPAAEEWDLNPDALMANTSSTVTIFPTITYGNGPVTLTSATGQGGLELSLTQPKLTSLANGQVTIKTPSTPGLYSYTVTAKDSGGAAQSQSGWVIVTVPAAKLTKTGDGQAGAKGSKVTLTATFVPGSSGAGAAGEDLLFTASAGTLDQRIVRTNASGQAQVTLTLPEKAGKVTVTAVGPVFWGTPMATFTVTAR